MTTAITTSSDAVSWRRTLGVGLVLYVIGLVIFGLTGNLNLFPALMLLGNFLIPVTFVAFFYQHRHLSTVRLPTVAGAFFYGGFLGAFAATVLEAIYGAAVQNSSLMGITLAVVLFLGVGVIEEGAKLLGVLVVARNAEHDAEIDGIILGAAAGMGFAALESIGYAFSAFVASQGSLTAALAATLLRGILAPVGHGTWTAIVASVLFRDTVGGRFRVDRAVLGAFLTAAVLHALWDASGPIIASLALPAGLTFVATVVVLAIVGATGLIVLWLRWREAVRREVATGKSGPRPAPGVAP